MVQRQGRMNVPKMTNRGGAGLLNKMSSGKPAKLTNRGPAGLLKKVKRDEPKINGEVVPVEVRRGKINNIVPALKAMAVDVDSLVPDPLNARLHPERNLQAIMQSLDAYGQRTPLVVNKRTKIVEKGNGSLEAAKALGWTKIAVVWVDDDEATAAGYGLADNRTAELARWNFEVVAKIDKLVADAGHPMIGWAFDELLAMRMEHGDEEQKKVVVFDQSRIVDAAYSHFRDKGFPYPELPIHACMQEINNLANTDADSLAGTNTANKVADVYHKHRWHASVEDKRTPFETYSDDDWFRTSIRKTIELGGDVGSTFVEGLRYSSGTQVCANFRPGFALLMYKQFAPPGATVLDTSTGFGGRLVGFLASGLNKYIGIDPNTETYQANKKMAKDLGFSDRVTLYKQPAEDVKHEVVRGKCDFAFTSPPYFRKEHYSDEQTQSWKRYNDGESWRDGFLLPMLALQYAALKKGCYSVVNIADVTIKNKEYPLVDWTIEAAKKVGFTYERQERYPLGRIPGGAKSTNDPYEPALVFKKE